MKRISFLVAMVFVVGCTNKTYVTINEPSTATPTDAGRDPVVAVSSDAGSTIVSDTDAAPTIVPDSGATIDAEIVVDTGRAIDSGAYGYASDDGASIDSGRTVASSDSGTEIGGIQPANDNCSVGDQVFIGRGNGSVMAGSSKGFGIVWNSNYRSATQTDVVFQAVDAHGANLAVAETVNVTESAIGPWLDIAVMSGSYVIDAVQAGNLDNFWFRNFDGSGMAATLNQPHGYLPIIGSDKEYFAFMNNGSLSPVLNKLQLGVGFFTVENTYQWGPSGARVFNATKAAKLGGSSWAFALVADTVTEVVAVDSNGVYPTVIIDTASIGGIVTVGDTVAIDEGYALRWSWFPSDLSTRRSFISFVPAKGSSDGKANNTIEISALAPGIQMVEYVDWNGKNLGYLAVNANPNPEDASEQVGKFFLLDKLGTVLKTATVASPFKPNTIGQNVSFASSGSSFGVTVSSVSDQTVRFQAVTCE
jgi:hypothetical protein